jgi:hypothetical protein
VLNGLCITGKTPELVSAAAAWWRAAPQDDLAVNWFSQALYIRALERDGLRSPCAPEPVFIDKGPPADPAEAILYDSNQNAQIGWDHIIRSAESRTDAVASLCLAGTVLAKRLDEMLFRRRLRILMDLGQDAELRSSIEALPVAPRLGPGKLAAAFSPYVPDYLGVGRETEAGELLLLLRRLDPSGAGHLEPYRKAVVLQIRRRYKDGSAERAERERWIAAHTFDTAWASRPRGRARN